MYRFRGKEVMFSLNLATITEPMTVALIRLNFVIDDLYLAYREHVRRSAPVF